MKKLPKFVCSLIILFSLTGCASMGTYNPATERNEIIFLSAADEISMGDEIHQELLKEYQFSSDTKKIDRLRRIGNQVALISDRQDYQYNFYLIDKDEMNAFTTLGGNIYFFTGLMDKLPKDDEIASVLAHEIGHCAAKHSVKKFQKAMSYDLLGRLVLSQLDGAAQSIANLSAGVLQNIIFSAYSRADEFEADRLGVKYMYLASFKMQSIIDTFNVLKTQEGSANGPPAFLRSHPYLDDRISAVKKEIQVVGQKYSR